jgi:hypothetical protein
MVHVGRVTQARLDPTDRAALISSVPTGLDAVGDLGLPDSLLLLASLGKIRRATLVRSCESKRLAPGRDAACVTPGTGRCGDTGRIAAADSAKAAQRMATAVGIGGVDLAASRRGRGPHFLGCAAEPRGRHLTFLMRRDRFSDGDTRFTRFGQDRRSEPRQVGSHHGSLFQRFSAQVSCSAGHDYAPILDGVVGGR